MQRWHEVGSSSSHKVRRKSRQKAEKTLFHAGKRTGFARNLRHGETVTINVGGRTYKVKRQLLESRKNTLLEAVALGREDIPCGCYRSDEGVYFFDRHPDVFYYVLLFYETGDFHIPSSICSKIVKRELKFWNIRDIRLEPCCWKLYNARLTELKDLKLIMTKCSMLDHDYSFLDPLLHGNMQTLIGMLQSIFAVMGVKDMIGRAYNTLSVVITLLNFVLTCSMSTLPARYSRMHATRLYDNKGNMTMKEILALTKPMHMHLGIELLFTTFFVVDQALRVWASNNRRHFLHVFLNLVDFVCNFVSITVLVFWLEWGYLPLFLENLSHFFRAMRTLRMMRHSRGLMMILYSIEVQIVDVAFMLAIFVVLIVFFGSAIFTSELFGSDLRFTPFVNLPKSFFWAGTTLTTVGYGNVVPTTAFSYIIAVMAALCGMYIIFLPIPLLARQFCLYYDTAKMKTTGDPPLIQRLHPRSKMYKR